MACMSSPDVCVVVLSVSATWQAQGDNADDTQYREVYHTLSIQSSHAMCLRMVHCISRAHVLVRDAQDTPLWKDKTCPACT